MAVFAVVPQPGGGFLPAGGGVQPDSGVLHQGLNALPALRVGVHRQHAGNAPLFPEAPVRVPLLNAQFQVDPEEGAPVHLAEHLNGASHQLYDAFGNGHAQPGALHLVGGAVFRSGKRVENGFQVFRRHAVAVVLHLHADMLILAGALLELHDAEADVPALRRVFYGVGKEVDQNLVDSGFVANQALVPDAGCLQMKVLLSGFGHGLDDGVHGGNHVVQGEFLQVQHDFSALDLGDVQNVVDEAEKVLAGGHDLLGIFPDLGRILRVLGEEGGESQHRVHGRADVMGHVGEEGRLGLAGDLSGLEGLRQLLAVQLPLRLLLLPELILLPPAEVVQQDAQEEGRQHGGYHDENILADGSPLLLDGLDGHVAHQEDGAAVYRPHVVQRLHVPDIVVEKNVLPASQARVYLRPDLRVLNVVGAVEIGQI